MKRVEDFDIIQEVVFEDGHGFALGYSRQAALPYATWQLPRCRAVRGIIIRADMNSARWMPRKILSVGRRITNIFQR